MIQALIWLPLAAKAAALTLSWGALLWLVISYLFDPTRNRTKFRLPLHHV
ncbi:hypothetical protein [Fibrella forsythiae]|uniref:Uncharacterized protein n=1 Tax=Fibrella forsythiae TaxID=2817061 RepID=A0ABS3JM43_9BACT|nr:hypothetical protein [Fibrella forsythiae]MBO0951082.1 hypothetical protein [Fibrella forsythiae]